MKVEDFTLQRDDDGNEFVTFAEGPTKTRQGGLSVKTRLVTPKMLATGNVERCPVMLFKRYLGKRPSEMKESGPFYLTVIDKPISSILYKETPMEKNTINTIMKNLKKNSPLKYLCTEKNLTTHSFYCYYYYSYYNSYSSYYSYYYYYHYHYHYHFTINLHINN